MNVFANTVVTLSFKLYDSSNKLIEQTDEPIAYLHGGHSGIFPKVEAALNAKKVGDTVSVTLEPDDAFGDYDAELMLLSVVIPVYNEADDDPRDRARACRRCRLDKEIIVVDDCSTDGTRDVLARARAAEADVRVILHSREPGQGRGPARPASQPPRGDIVVVQDADLEYDPASIPKLIQPILDGQGRRGVRLALHRRAPPRAVLLALASATGS